MTADNVAWCQSFEPALSTYGALNLTNTHAASQLVSVRQEFSHLMSNDTYMYFWLTSELAMGEMRERGTGVAIPSLNSTAFRAVPVLVPDAAAVHRFTHDVEAVVAAILRNAKESQTLASVGDALLPKLMSGELAPANTIDIREVAS